MAGRTPLVVERFAIGDYRKRCDNEQQGNARSHANTLYDNGWQMSISRCAMRAGGNSDQTQSLSGCVYIQEVGRVIQSADRSFPRPANRQPDQRPEAGKTTLPRLGVKKPGVELVEPILTFGYQQIEHENGLARLLTTVERCACFFLWPARRIVTQSRTRN
jgi:hypothetical protein